MRKRFCAMVIPGAGLWITLAIAPIAGAAPVGTAFTYQGYLTEGTGPANGVYDFQIRLYDAASLGSQVGNTVTVNDKTVSGGLFTVSLDFGASPFTGSGRWLEIGVRPGASSGSYTPLSPRQALTPTPYALALPGLRTSQNGVSPSIIGGYGENSVTSGILSATVSGGGNPDGPNRATDHYSTVSGGEDNQAGNGDTNLMNSAWSTVAGGTHNMAGGMYSVVSGGIQNTASGGIATALGGYGNTASGYLGTTLGGVFNTAQGQNSAAAGSYARALHDGCFVWGDASVPFMTWFDSTNPNQFLIRAVGGVGINTTSPTSALTVQGMIESKSEGFMFPDGTIQTTAAGGGGEGLSLPYDGTTASSVPAFSATNTSGSVAIRGLATNAGGGINYGGYFEAYGNEGRAVAGAVASSNGFAGYFQGRGFFSDNVGIGTDMPEGRLDVRGGDLIVDSSTGGLRIGYGGTGDGWSFATAEGGQTLLLQERPGGGSGDMRVAVSAGGNVGIGITHPQARLDVDGGDILVRGPNSFDATGEEATVWLGDANHYIKGVYGKGVTIGTWWVGDVMYVTEPYGWIGINTDMPQADLHVNGRTRTNVLEIVGGSDLAEPFVVNEPSAVNNQQSAVSGQQSASDCRPSSLSTQHSALITPHPDTVQPGMVVVIDPENPGQLKLAAEAYDRKVAGVISGAKGLNPGMIMRAEGTEQADGDHPVALSGRVWCWCDAKYGPVVPGDRLTTSATPGHAMRVADRDRADGAVLGKAMTSLDHGTGLVLVLVTLQ